MTLCQYGNEFYKRSMANIADLNNNIKLTATPPPLQKKENKF